MIIKERQKYYNRFLYFGTIFLFYVLSLCAMDFSYAHAGQIKKEKGQWLYYNDRGDFEEYTGLCKHKTTWYYINKGKVDLSAETLVKYNKRWYYVKYGKLKRVDCVYKYKGTEYIITNGVVTGKIKNPPVILSPDETKKGEITVQIISNIEDIRVANSIYSWWTYPIACRDLDSEIEYLGFTDNNGNQGVASIDVANRTVTRTALMKGAIDDHNAPAVMVLDDGRVLVVCTDHGKTKTAHLFISKEPGNIEYFVEKTFSLPEGYGKLSYAQLICLNRHYFMFCRCREESTGLYYWMISESIDGINWGTAYPFLKAGYDLYYLLARVYDDHTIKLVMTAHPSSNDCDIRMGFIDVPSGNIFSTVNSFIGNYTKDQINYEHFPVIVFHGNRKIRLLDVGIGIDNSILFSRISGKDYSTYLSREIEVNRVEYEIPSQGKAFGPNYQNGACFLDKDHIVVCNNKEKWETIIYEFTNGAFCEVYGYTNDSSESVKMMRPTKCINNNSVYINQGLYNEKLYTDFSTDIVRITR